MLKLLLALVVAAGALACRGPGRDAVDVGPASRAMVLATCAKAT